MRSATLLFLLICVLPISAHAQKSVNAGFVQGLWYETQPVFAGETVRIYAALRNNTKTELTGTVTFWDNGTIIARKEVGALSGRLIETWADWKPTYGEHTVRAELTDVQLHSVGRSPEPVDVTEQTSQQQIFVDQDTDSDKIGNKKDKDDDNDGIPDTDEQTNGTDPLVPNSARTAQTDTDAEIEESSTQKNEQDSGETKSVQTQSTKETSGGFEKYFDNETMRTVLSGVTERVEKSKASLDAYRKRRTAETEEQTESKVTGNATSTDNGAAATITRTQSNPEKKGIITTLFSGIIGITNTLYTLLLWIISKILSHPALVQFLLLFAILTGVYKLARRFGSRQ